MDTPKIMATIVRWTPLDNPITFDVKRRKRRRYGNLDHIKFEWQ
jgi:hypothetical protein